MVTRWCSIGPVLLLAGLAVQAAQDEKDPAPATKKSHWYQGGQIRLGAFFVSNIETTIGATPAGSPVGLWLTSGSGGGLADSVEVPRLTLSYRVTRRHLWLLQIRPARALGSHTTPHSGR